MMRTIDQHRLITLILWIAVFTPGWAQEEEAKDCPYFPGMTNYEIGEHQDLEFEAAEFYDGKGSKTVEGRYWNREYRLKEGALQASEIQIIRNYANAVRKAGGRVFNEGTCNAATCGDFEGMEFLSGAASREGKEIWLQVVPHVRGGYYMLTVVEKEAMRQDVTASDLLQALNNEGHVALYINFDTNRATIKPESAAVIEQVIAMLRGDPSLRISIEGHTDNTGTPQANKVLSEQRAKAVLAELVKGGIETGRLMAVGWGQEKPIGDNTTEEGRAKNRRVELVKK